MNSHAPNPANNSETLADSLTFLGFTELDGIIKTFGILKEDRRRHMYVLGKSGMGKSTFLENMALQDIFAGNGVCFVDPLGDSAERLASHIPNYRLQDVIYLDPSDEEFPIGLNILENSNGEPNFLIASETLGIFSKIWAGTWSGRMEYFLNNAILALLETPGNTLVGIAKMFTDKQFRKYIVSQTTNIIVKNFWENEYPTYSETYKAEAAAAIINKINQFLGTSLLRNIVGQTKSTINLRQIMDEGKILIVNLSKGKIGDSNARLLGAMLISKIQMAAMSRVNIPENARRDFYLYVDEFQNMISDTFATILSEARKYRLNLTIANQYLDQLVESENETVKNAIFGNVGTIVTFQTSFADSEFLSEQFFGDKESSKMFQDLDKAQILAKLFIQTKSIEPIVATTLAPLYTEFSGSFGNAKKLSQQKWGRPRAWVEEQIAKYFSQSLITTETGEILKAKAPKRKRIRKENSDNSSPNSQNSEQNSPKIHSPNNSTNYKIDRATAAIERMKKFLPKAYE